MTITHHAQTSLASDRTTSTTQFSPGDRIGDRYRVVGMLGSGGMGEVYAVEHLHLGRRFAAKVLREELTSQALFTARFNREIRAMAGLHSDHIAQIVDIGTVSYQRPYFVMELLVGTDLKALLERSGTLPTQRALGIVRGACLGLKAVHEAGLVHRDIKPANLFVARTDSGADRCVLLDLGVAKSQDTFQTKTGQVVGTFAYMAPEQLDGRAVDARTDLYSLGAVLYECLSGHPLHVAETLERTMYSIMNKDPVPLRKLRPELPEQLCEVVQRAIRRNPNDRFADADTMFAALTSLVVADSGPGDCTVTMAPDCPMRPDSRARVPGRLWLPVSVFLGITMLMVSRLPFGQGRRAETLERPDEHPRILPPLASGSGIALNHAPAPTASVTYSKLEMFASPVAGAPNGSAFASPIAVRAVRGHDTPQFKAEAPKHQRTPNGVVMPRIEAENPY